MNDFDNMFDLASFRTYGEPIVIKVIKNRGVFVPYYQTPNNQDHFREDEELFEI